MNRIKFLLVILHVTSMLAQAQTFEVHESPSTKIEKEYLSLGKSGSNEWSIHNQGINGWELVSSDFKGKEIGNIVMDRNLPSESLSLDNAWLVGKEITLVGYYWNEENKSETFYVGNYDMNGKQIGDWIPLATIAVTRNEIAEAKYLLSEDKRGFVISALSPDIKGGIMTYQLMSYSFADKKNHAYEFNLKTKERDLVAYHFTAKRPTKVIVTEHGEDHPDKSEKIANKQDPELHQIMVIDMEKGKQESFEFSIPDKLIIDAIGIETPNGIAVAGFYSDELKRKKADCDGNFSLILSSGEWGTANVEAWDLAFKIEALGKKAAEKGKALNGAHRVRYIKNISGGNFAVFGEQYGDFENDQGNKVHYSSGILCVAYDGLGKTVWSHYIKNIVEKVYDDENIGFNVFVTPKYVHVVFMDDRGNWGKNGREDEVSSRTKFWNSYFTSATFDEQGTLVFHRIYDADDIHLMMDPKNCTESADGSVAFYGKIKMKNGYGRVYFID
ncbi:MAG: hypothetical protein GC180_01745 [Bacteroidetes bacterium]|nr:hypothetical protein [Bacteroidota bacterium]